MLQDKDHLVDPGRERTHEYFHTALLSSCGSGPLPSVSGRLSEDTSRYRHLSVRVPLRLSATPRDAVAEHEAPFDAALSHRATLTRNLLEIQLRIATERVLIQPRHDPDRNSKQAC